MEFQKGDCVLVNLAPLIGSVRRSRESIPCEVLAVADGHVQVRTSHPYRELSLWTSVKWIDGKRAS